MDQVRALGGKPFLTDTRTLYKGSRANAVDHMTVAYEHGFSFATVDCPIHIADGLTGRRGSNVTIDKKLSFRSKFDAPSPIDGQTERSLYLVYEIIL